MQRSVARVLLLAYLAFMLTLTLLILPGHHPDANLVPFRSIGHDWRVGGRPFVVNFAGNILAFVPFGVLIPLARWRPTGLGQVALAGLALSGSIELAQYASGRRVGDIDDVILNVLGVIVGYSTFAAARRIVASRRTDRESGHESL